MLRAIELTPGPGHLTDTTDTMAERRLLDWIDLFVFDTGDNDDTDSPDAEGQVQPRSIPMDQVDRTT